MKSSSSRGPVGLSISAVKQLCRSPATDSVMLLQSRGMVRESAAAGSGISADLLLVAVDPIVPLAFLHQLHLVLESYVGGAVTEASLKVSLWLRCCSSSLINADRGF